MAYTPYKPTTYPSGTGVFDIFNFNVPSVTGGSSVTRDVTFSNPFVILGGYDNSSASFLHWEQIKQNIVIYQSPPALNSGLLVQESLQGGGIIPLTAALSLPDSLMRIFQLTDLMNPGQTLTIHTHGGGGDTETVQQPTYYSNVKFLELLDRSFDSFAFPANFGFTLEPGGLDISLIIAVKRGANQPFFTLLPL